MRTNSPGNHRRRAFGRQTTASRMSRERRRSLYRLFIGSASLALGLAPRRDACLAPIEFLAIAGFAILSIWKKVGLKLIGAIFRSLVPEAQAAEATAEHQCSTVARWKSLVPTRIKLSGLIPGGCRGGVKLSLRRKPMLLCQIVSGTAVNHRRWLPCRYILGDNCSGCHNAIIRNGDARHDYASSADKASPSGIWSGRFGRRIMHASIRSTRQRRRNSLHRYEYACGKRFIEFGTG